jgi:hypothetical protein
MTYETYCFQLDGEIIESDLISATAAEWAASEESHSPDWSVCRIGRKVRANRLTIPRSLLASSIRAADEKTPRRWDVGPSRN